MQNNNNIMQNNIMKFYCMPLFLTVLRFKFCDFAAVRAFTGAVVSIKRMSYQIILI